MISTTTTIVFFVYLALMILVGLWAYFTTKSYNDYIIGGRRIGPTVTALSAGASDMSGWLLMGLPGAIFASGLSEAWIAVGLIIGAYFNYLIVSRRLRVYTEVNNAVTLPVFFSKRVGGSTTLRLICSIVIIVFFTLYSASGMVAGANIFEFLFGIDYKVALYFGAFATVIYVVIGGFLGVSWTDSIQGTLMLFALIITPIVVMYYFGGFSNTINAIDVVGKAKDIDYNQIFNIKFISFISLMAWGLGYFGQPHILIKFFSTKNAQTLNQARRIGITWMVLCLIGAVAIGYFGIAYFSDPSATNYELVHNNNERVFIGFTTALFHPIIAGILLSAILSAVMSTLSSQLLLASTSIVEDLYKVFLNRQPYGSVVQTEEDWERANQKKFLWLGRLFVIIIALIAVSLAYDPKSSILKLVSYAWAGFGSAFGPLVILSLFYKNLNKFGAIAGVVIGAVIVVLWNPEFLDAIGLASLDKVYSMIPGFILSFIGILVVSTITGGANNDVKAKFDKARSMVGQK